MTVSENVVVTGASGQLGRLVVADLVRTAPEVHVIGIVRNPEAAKDLADRGVELRVARYEDAASVAAALVGADNVLLISSSEARQRIPQHRHVIDAAKAVDAKLFAYTSILHADTNPMALAAEHRETEALIRSSGLPFVLLRNGWYTENYTAGLAAALRRGAVLGRRGRGVSHPPRAPTSPRPRRPCSRAVRTRRAGSTSSPATAPIRSRSLPPRSPGSPAGRSSTGICPRPTTRRRCRPTACRRNSPRFMPRVTSRRRRALSTMRAGN